jgi:hypothetical protein
VPFDDRLGRSAIISYMSETETSKLVRPGLAYSTDMGEVIDLTDAEARYVLDHDPTVRKEWSKWTAMSGQARIPVKERTGRVVLLDAERVQRLLRQRPPQ